MQTIYTFLVNQDFTIENDVSKTSGQVGIKIINENFKKLLINNNECLEIFGNFNNSQNSFKIGTFIFETPNSDNTQRNMLFFTFYGASRFNSYFNNLKILQVRVTNG